VQSEKQKVEERRKEMAAVDEFELEEVLVWG